MTMIAIQEKAGFPLIIGDLLTSSSVKTDFMLPTFNTSIDFPCGKYYPYKLTQKVYIVNPNIVVAIAGDYFKNEIFVNDIKLFFDKKKATKENMDIFWNKYVNQTMDNEAYGICRVDPDSLETECRYLGKWYTKKTLSMGTINSVGSGTSDFFRMIDSFGEKNLINVKSYYDAIVNFYQIFSAILGEERYFASNILNAWGAGFEIVVFDYQKRTFVKLDEISYVIWRGKYSIEKDEFECVPVATMTNKYLGEALSISCHVGDSPHLYIALPIYMKKEEFDLSLIPDKLFTNSSKVCNIIEIEVIEKNIIQPICVYAENNSDLNAVFIEYDENGQFLVAMSTDLSKEIENKIRLLAQMI